MIVSLNSAGAGACIYCIHSIGGDLSGYDHLASALGNEHRIFGLQVPKTMMVANDLMSIEDRASRYANAIMHFQPDGPLVIVGYSAGAVIALEVAQQLLLKGRVVPLLVAFDGAPGNTEAGLRPSQVGYWWRLLCNLPWRLANLRARDLRFSSLRTRLAFRRSITSQTTPSYHRTNELAAVSKVVERDGWPEEQRLFIRMMYQAMVAYVPRTYAGAVILYEVRAQPLFQLVQFGAVWRKIAAVCEVVSVNARHSDFFESRSGLRHVAGHLREAIRSLNEAQRSSEAMPRPLAPSAACLDQSLSGSAFAADKIEPV